MISTTSVIYCKPGLTFVAAISRRASLCGRIPERHLSSRAPKLLHNTLHRRNIRSSVCFGNPYRLHSFPRTNLISTTMSLGFTNGSRPHSHSPLRPGSTRTFENPIAPVDDGSIHPVLHEGRVAVITGAGSGIGRAAAVELAKCVCERVKRCDRH